MMTIEERLAALESKVDSILTIVSSIDSNTMPCKEKQTGNLAALSEVMKILDNSPISKNPMIVEILKPLRDVLVAQGQGGKA